ncbi:MAG: hypothetical protein C0615_05200 [Desulfuromonas sp.]|nr:MAG: hypothetical protein C0615_05200 [Desulfuromonas sp.]
MESINTPVRVGAVFGPGNRIKPVWFDWKKRKYTIQEITYRWQEQDGEETAFHFAVSDGNDLFELAYNSGSQIWLLTALEVGNG